MNSQIMNMALVMGAMQITNRLDLEDPQTKQMIVGIYVAAQAIVIGISFFIQSRIQAKKDTTELKYMEQPKPFSGEEPKLVVTTNMKYDLEQNAQAQKQALIGLTLMVFLHFKFGVIRPLVVQSILPLKNALQSKWAQVHLFGKAAEGDLRRPWKADNPFEALAGGGEKPSEAAEKAAIKKAEKAENKASGSKSESKKNI